MGKKGGEAAKPSPPGFDPTLREVDRAPSGRGGRPVALSRRWSIEQPCDMARVLCCC